MNRPPVHADQILIGRVLTLDDRGSRAEAVAVANGTILAVGTREAVLETRGPATVVRDFPGAALIPGFNDAHAHLDGVGLRSIRPSLEHARSIGDILAVIRGMAERAAPGTWLVTMPVGMPPYYFDGPGTLTEGRMPTRQELDSVAPLHPVYIGSPNGYWGQLPCHSAMNSLGLERNGIDRHTKPQSPAIEIVKDAAGEPNGQFVERSLVNLIEPDILPAVPRFSYEQRRDGIVRAMQLYHQRGTTSVYEGHGSAPEVLAAYREVWERGDLTMRAGLVVSPRWRSLEEAQRVMRDWMPLLRGRGIGDATLRVAGVFVAHGGDPCISAVQHRELDHVGWSGLVQTTNTPEDFEALCMLAGRYDVRLHTIASDKLHQLIPILERVATHYPIGARRWVVEHISRSRPEDLQALRRLGLPATLIPGHYLWKQGTAFLGLSPAELDHLSPARQLAELGVPVSAGTDAVPYDPLFCLWAMTVRRERTTGRVLGEAGRTSNDVALRLLTRAGAYLTFDEGVKGQLVPGHFADIAVLSGDPLETTGDALLELTCTATMAGGRWVHGDR
jgi:predicted amidohydrolase YtcJ